MAYASAPRSLLLKAETTYGTAETLAPADVMRCRRIAPNPQGGEWKSRELVSPWGGASPEMLVGKFAGVEFDFEVAGSGTAGAAPAWAAALIMCGWAEVVTAGSDATYTPVDSGYGSATMRWRIGGAAPGLAQTVAGARGSLNFTARAREIPFFAVNAVGKYERPAAAAAPAITPLMLEGFKKPVSVEPLNVPAFAWGGVKLCFTEFSLSDGRTPGVGLYANCDAVDLGARNFTGRVTVRHEELGYKDLLAESETAALQSFSLILGTVAGNIIEIAAPAAQIKFSGFAEIGADLGSSFDVVFPRLGPAPEISIKVS